MEKESAWNAKIIAWKNSFVGRLFLSTSAKKGYVTLFDQSIVSFVHFLSSLLLARFLVPAEFGIWVLAYSVLIFAYGVQQALIISPMMVFGAATKGDEAKNYFTSTGIMQAIFGIIVIIILLITSGILHIIYKKPETTYIFLVMSITSFSFLGQEFFRRALFTQLRAKDALKNDILCYGLQIIGIIALFYLGILNAVNTFWIIALTAFLAIIYGYYQCHNLLKLHLVSWSKTIKENWDFGKWLLLSSLLTLTSGQAYFFIAAFLLGPVAPAVLRACQNIYGPCNILLLGIQNIAQPEASKRYSQKGISMLNSFLIKVLLFMVITMGIYCFAASFSADFLLHILYKDKYIQYGNIVILLGINYIIGALMQIPGIGLRAIRKPKALFYAYAASSITTITLSIPLIKYFYITGAAMGLAINVFIVLAVTFFLFKKYKHEISGPIAYDNK
jgi:O-antigen/teichoic acid export membrane protein